MASITPLLDREWDAERYHCGHFAADAWRHLTGADLPPALAALALPPAEQQIDLAAWYRLQPLALPVAPGPALAVMWRRHTRPHIGVWWRGRIAHLLPTGAEWTPPATATRGLFRVRYYA